MGHMERPTRFIPLAGTLKRGTFWPIFGVCVQKASHWGGDIFFSRCVCVPWDMSHQKKKGGDTFYRNFKFLKMQVLTHSECYKVQTY